VLLAGSLAAFLAASAFLAAFPATLVAAAQPASAAGRPAPRGSARAVAQLATANIGKHACSRNTLGGHSFGSSCTGDGGRPEYWCADFAKWVWQHEGVEGARLLTPAAGSFYSYGLRFGTLSAMPAVGDVAVFNYYGGGVAEHVAVVTAVHSDGSIETVSGDWGGTGGSEVRFASTSTVTLNGPFYKGVLGSVPGPMGMVVSGFVAPAAVRVAPVAPSDSLPAGSTLLSGQSLASPNGTFSLVMQPGGDLVEEAGGRIVWSSRTAKLGGSYAVLETDGELVVDSAAGEAVWSSGSTRQAPDGVRLLLDDYGRLSITGATGRIWTYQPVADRLAAGERLLPGERLVSGNGLYDLVMQADGNLVETTAGRPLWSTVTGGHHDASALLQRGSDLVVYARSGRALWASGPRRPAGSFRLVLAPTGTISVEGPAGIVWAKSPAR
jgi:hypothetical protein